ncbi:MAG: hypothetical protein ACOY90_14880 [Candidatus Zhuqueibacterota bacterium]
MTEFYYLFNVVLFSRLMFTFRDEPITLRQTGVIVFLQLLGTLMFEMNLLFALLVFMMLALNGLVFLLEKKIEWVNIVRVASLIGFIVVFSLVFAPRNRLNFNPHLLAHLESWADISLIIDFLSALDWRSLNPILTGAFFVTNETNIFIRLIFQTFTLTPAHEESAGQTITTVVDKQEYNAGRIIGLLERLLIYYFVLNNQLVAIGFIVAVKSFARKDLKSREFAEYVLIGTLLSTLTAVFIANLVQLALRH